MRIRWGRLTAVAVAATLAPGVQAGAVSVPGGCVAVAPTGTATCSYVAASGGAFVAGAQVFRIRVVRSGSVVWTLEHPLIAPPQPQGSIPSQAGDTVEVTVYGITVVPPFVPPVDLTGGAVAAHDA